jgi:hypothetical protein
MSKELSVAKAGERVHEDGGALGLNRKPASDFLKNLGTGIYQ